MQLLEQDIIEVCDDIKDILSKLNNKTIIITGGQGFIGRYICEAVHLANQKYLETPCKVIVIDNGITSNNEHKIEDKYFQYHYQSTSNKIDIQADYILYLAGIASPYYYRKYKLETIETVSIGLINLLNIAKKYNAKLLFTSSSEIYGNPFAEYIPTNEKYNGNVSTLSDRACYDESKRLGETLCKIYHQENVNAVIVRLFNIFGVPTSPHDYRVLPNFANNILNGRDVQLYGDGNQTRTFCYGVDGAVGILRALLLGKSGEVYNIGSSEPEISMKTLLEKCEDVLVKNDIKYLPIKSVITPKPEHYPVDGDPTRRCPNINKAKSELGFNPKIQFEDGLTRFLKWASIHYRKTND